MPFSARVKLRGGARGAAPLHLQTVRKPEALESCSSQACTQYSCAMDWHCAASATQQAGTHQTDSAATHGGSLVALRSRRRFLGLSRSSEGMDGASDPMPLAVLGQVLGRPGCERRFRSLKVPGDASGGRCRSVGRTCLATPHDTSRILEHVAKVRASSFQFSRPFLPHLSQLRRAPPYPSSLLFTRPSGVASYSAHLSSGR